MALIVGHSQAKYFHEYIHDANIIPLSYPGFRVDQLWSEIEDLVPSFQVSKLLLLGALKIGP